MGSPLISPDISIRASGGALERSDPCDEVRPSLSSYKLTMSLFELAKARGASISCIVLRE